MTQTIDPKRLKQVRTTRGLTQDQLAKKCRPILNKQTIYRLEQGEAPKPIRKANLERLAQALDVDPGVLTGERPMPPFADQVAAPAEEAAYQLNVRVDAAVRSGFELVARRYKVSPTKIAQLAPLLFVIVAEESLRYRRKKLREFKAALDQHYELESESSYLPTLNSPVDPYDVVSAEKGSIERRDLFGEDLAKMGNELDWGEADDNPFEAYLKAQAEIVREHELDRQLEAYLHSEIAKRARVAKPDATSAEISATIEANLDKFTEKYGRDWRAANRERVVDDLCINAVGSISTDYQVCRSEAEELAGDDAEIAEWILKGEVPIHTLRRDRRGLLEPDAVAERLEWMRQNKISVRKMEEEAPTIDPSLVKAIEIQL